MNQTEPDTLRTLTSAWQVSQVLGTLLVQFATMASHTAGSTASFAKEAPPVPLGSQTALAAAAAAGAAGGDAPRSFQEVDFLKDAVGQPLIAALADVVIHRPADPIEYLGHWLIHFKFNEALRKQDVKTALELVQQKEWEKYKEVLGFTSAGFTPDNPYGPIGYGGPIFGGEASGEAEGEGKSHEEPGEEDVEQLYRNARRSQELVGEYGREAYGYDEGEDSDRPISYYSEPPPTGTDNEILSSVAHTAESKTSQEPAAAAAASSRSVMSTREVQQRRETRTKARNESLPDPTKVPPQFRRPSEEEQDDQNDDDEDEQSQL